jgi:uncharacterized membrane protein
MTPEYVVPVVAFGIGVVAGLRSMIAPAAVAIAKGAPILAIVLVAGALAEIVFDKLPKTPSRLRPPTLLFRCISGAGSAFFLTGTIVSAVFGLLGALAGSYGGAAFRRAVPGLPAAFVEDVATIALASLVIHFLSM